MNTKTVHIPEQTLEILNNSYTINELKELKDKNNMVSAILAFDFNNIANLCFEDVMDLFSEALTGTTLLSDIDYDILAVKNSEVYIRITGDVSLIIESKE